MVDPETVAGNRTWSVTATRSLIGLASLLILSQLTSAGFAEDRNLEAIRALLANPPSLEYYIYENIVPPHPELARILATNGTPLRVVRGRYQGPDAHWSQHLETTNVTPEARLGMLSGRLSNVWWEAHAGSLTTYTPQENSNRPTKESHIYRFAMFSEVEALRLLRLGLPEIDFPHATWNGPSFAATAVAFALTPSEHAYKVLGRISQKAPDTFEIATTNATSLAPEDTVLLHYSTRPPAATPFPDLIERFGSRQGKVTKYISHRIYAVQLAAGELPRTMFDPTQMPELLAQNTFLYSNEVLYGRSLYLSNRVVRIPTKEELAKQRRPLYARPAFLSIFLLTMLTALIWRALFRKTLHTLPNKTYD